MPITLSSFTRDELALRERLYGGYCRQSRFVCVQAEWTRQDVIRHFGIAPEKVVVVPWGSVFDAYEPPSQSAIDATREKYNLPDAFFFYPAITWPHKNHEVIFRALHQLKSEGQFVPEVFFTGASSEHRMVLDKLANKLGVAEHVHFLGFLPPAELQSLFVLATAMVFPSLFEGFGLPILEAFHMRLPVIAATATTLPEIAQDAALYFDPHSPEELANRMKELLAQPELRETAGGQRRVRFAASLDETHRRGSTSALCEDGECRAGCVKYWRSGQGGCSFNSGLAP